MIVIKVLILAFGILAIVSCSGQTNPDEIDATVARSEILKRVNAICADMPKPESFRFVRKELGGNTNMAVLTFYYLSDKRMDEIKAFYEDWARNAGWSFLEESLWDESRYVKGNQFVVIEFQPMGDSNVEISCKERR